MDWFEQITGFKEVGYQQTQQRLAVRGEYLHSTATNRQWGIGRLETPQLGELRVQAMAGSPTKGTLNVQAIAADAKALHAATASQGALFQVASQFNLLEMMHPSVTPEDGVTRYEHDPTQGPACAIAAGAATIYRNYLVQVDGPAGPAGQTAERQINTLADLSTALGPGLIEMRNGYALCSVEQLQHINRLLASLDETQRDALRAQLRIGLHWDVEVTTPGEGQGQRVSQAFCSALPVAYNSAPTELWAPLARLVLEAAYEATLWAGIINMQRGASQDVYLTMLGGGAFGNESDWIVRAIQRALDLVADHNLRVYLVSYRHIPQSLEVLAQRYSP